MTGHYIEYLILRADSPGELQAHANRALAQGWEPIGGPAQWLVGGSVIAGERPAVHFTQAIVRTDHARAQFEREQKSRAAAAQDGNAPVTAPGLAEARGSARN